MLRFLLRRLVLAALVVITVLTVSFALTHVAGDLATAIAGPNATAADVEAVRKAYGLDRPVLVQFAEWATRAARGDFGDSLFSNEKVSTLIAHRLPVTATLGFVGIAIALALALPLGIIAAVRQNT